jgi:hypothetical protein
MERRINKKIDDYVRTFKSDLVSHLSCHCCNNDLTNNLSEYIYNYQGLQLDKESFSKRKRVKNSVPIYERCNAKRANGEQCTRRRKDGEKFCGTHSKGTPHGFIDDTNNDSGQKKIEVFIVEIKGIAYYIDNVDNIYSPEDVMSNKENPRIIAKYQKVNGEYKIKE